MNLEWNFNENLFNYSDRKRRKNWDGCKVTNPCFDVSCYVAFGPTVNQFKSSVIQKFYFLRETTYLNIIENTKNCHENIYLEYTRFCST